MFRSVCHILVAGWIAAALTVSPVLAAMQCRLCCDRTPAIAAAPHQQPACCPRHARVKPGESSGLREPSDSCPTCPNCTVRRVDVAAVNAASENKVPEPAILPGRSALPDEQSELSAIWHFGQEIRNRATPPPRVLFCTWLK